MMKKLPLFLLAAPLFLTACGDNYEMIKTETMFPYGNQRTAGSGVAYVLAKMMPKHELNLEPVADPAPAPPEALEETKEILGDMDAVFKEAQTK